MRNKNITNAGWIIGCKIIQSLLGIVISMLTARYLGPSNFGLINYAAAIVAFISPVATLGLSHVVIKEMVYEPEAEGKILGTSILMSLISSILCIAGIISFATITSNHDRETVIICGLYSFLLISSALEFVQYWFQAKLISKYTAVVSVAAYFLTSVYKAVLLITKQRIYWFAVSNALDHFIIGCVLLTIYHKKKNYKLEFSLDWAKQLLSRSRYFIVSGMLVTIFAQTDKIMLKFMIDDAATGIYAAASSCAGMTSFVFVAIIDSMRPTIVEDKRNNSLHYERNICNLYTIIIYMALLQSLMMTLLAKPIILLLYGPDYLSSAAALRVIVWHTTFSYLGSIRNVWILAEERQQYLWLINICGAFTNILLNLLFIRFWGVVGAAFASVITQIFTNVIIGFFFKPLRPNNDLMLRGLNPKIIWVLCRKMIGHHR